MPQKPQTNMKGTSPSKFINNANNVAWNAQNTQSTKTAQAAIAKQYNKNPFPVKGGKS